MSWQASHIDYRAHNAREKMQREIRESRYLEHPSHWDRTVPRGKSRT